MCGQPGQPGAIPTRSGIESIRSAYHHASRFIAGAAPVCAGDHALFFRKCPGDSEAVLEKLASLPQILAGHVQEGKLQEQFAQLPSLPQLQRELITRMGSCEFNWDLLPESTRKLTLPLQVSLLMLQDANSEAMLQQQLQDQWLQTWERHFAQEAWISATI